MYESPEDIDRSRAAMRARIEMLNQKHCETAEELRKILKEQAELGKKLMRADVLSALFGCFANLIRRTPVDTGRLRAGWQISGDASDLEYVPPVTYDGYKDQIGFNLSGAIQDSIRNSVFTEADSIYVFNNVEYLLALNAGWSKSQAGNFIDMFLQELKGELQKAASRK